jgi:hypothetical protein
MVREPLLGVLLSSQSVNFNYTMYCGLLITRANEFSRDLLLQVAKYLYISLYGNCLVW